MNNIVTSGVSCVVQAALGVSQLRQPSKIENREIKAGVWGCALVCSNKDIGNGGSGAGYVDYILLSRVGCTTTCAPHLKRVN